MSVDDPDDDGPADDRRRRPRPGEDADDRRRRRRPPPAVEATDFLIPTGVSRWSMAACYIGLVSCFLPVVGMLVAVGAIVCGVIALRRRKQTRSYGAVTSDVRAIVGIVLGTLTLVAHVGFVAFAIIREQMK